MCNHVEQGLQLKPRNYIQSEWCICICIFFIFLYVQKCTMFTLFFEWCVNYSSLTGCTADSAMATSTASADSVTTKSSTRLSAMSWVADPWTETQRTRCRCGCSDVECSPKLSNNTWLKIVPEIRFLPLWLQLQGLRPLLPEPREPGQITDSAMSIFSTKNANVTKCKLKLNWTAEQLKESLRSNTAKRRILLTVYFIQIFFF